VTVAKNNPFHGKVTSPKHACEVKRTVKIIVDQPGGDDLFGRTKTARATGPSPPRRTATSTPS
jgi:hypothetical protein